MNQRDQQRQKSHGTRASDWAKGYEKREFEPTAIRLPEGVEYFKLDKPGPIIVDFMQYIVGESITKRRRDKRRADVGFPHFECEYVAHRVPGPDGNSRMYLCLYENFGKKCPICIYRNSSSTSKEVSDALKNTVRHLWIVNPEPGNMDYIQNTDFPFKVFDTNHYNQKKGFGEQMIMAIEANQSQQDFSDLEGGMSVKMMVEVMTMPGRKWNGVGRIDFVPRDYDYPEWVLDKCPCLDDCLIELSYEALQEVIHQGEVPSRSATASTSRATVSSVKSLPPVSTSLKEIPSRAGNGHSNVYPLKVGDVVTHPSLGECDVDRVSPDGVNVILKDSNGQRHQGVPSCECELVPTQENQSRLKPPASVLRSPSSKSVPPSPVQQQERDLDEVESVTETLMEEEPKQPPSRFRGKK